VSTYAQAPTLSIVNLYFAQGFEKGHIWFERKEWDEPIDDEYLIVNIASMCERQAHKSPNDLAWYIGFVAAMFYGNFLLE
jgi:hypothetical protein